jgi:hypothetical protein
MDPKFGRFIVLGLVIGGVLGLLYGPAIGNTALGLGLGALGGVFIGWFVAAAVLQNQNEKKENPK